MLENYSSTPSQNESAISEGTGLGEHDIPEPLELWSEQDFDDLVPSWGKP
jgi:hypothetical protein